MVVFVNGVNGFSVGRKKSFNKFVGVEISEIVNLFADADKTDRQVHLPGDAGNNSSFGRTVKFGQRHTGNANGVIEQLGLGDTILTSGCIYDQQHFVRSTFELLVHDALDLFQ